MLYLLGIIALIALIYGAVRLGKSGNKEFRSKLSLKERTDLEKMIEKKPKEQEENIKKEEEKIPETVIPKTKQIFPAKDILLEIRRFATYINIDNPKIQQSVRSGVSNFLNQDFKTALEDFSLAIELNSSDSSGYYCRGLTKLKLKNYESAINDFTEAINLKMKEPTAYYYRAHAYHDLQLFENAILNYQSYINLENRFADAFYNLGICYKNNEKYTAAIDAFSHAIEKEPKYDVAYFERALMKHKMNDNQGCCDDLKKALELNHPQAADYITELCREKKW